MHIKKMSLAWISLSDMAQSKKFFSETLGLKLVSEAPEYGWMELKASESSFRLGAGICTDTYGVNPVQPGNNAVVTMTVDDLASSMDELKKKGVSFVGEVVEVPGHVKMVFFQDPDGNYFQLVQELSPMGD